MDAVLPGTGTVPSAEPSPSEGRPDPRSSTPPAPVHIGPFPSAAVSPTGTLVYGETPWTRAVVPKGYTLVRYDIGALAPTAPRLLPALRGIPDTSPPAPTEIDPWWADLVEALVEAVGRDRWPASDTLLAWRPERAALYVQQDAEGHAGVQALLTRRAADRLSDVHIVVELGPTPAESADQLRVDVPWGRTVRAHHGLVWAFLDVEAGPGLDFDVELIPSFIRPVPLVAGLDTGQAVTARLVEAEDGTPAIDVEVAATHGQPRFEASEVTPSYTFIATTIEVPHIPVTRWRGRVPAQAGKHDLELDDGRSATLTVHAPRTGYSPDPPYVASVLAPRRPSPSTRPAQPPSFVSVTWLASGPLQGCTCTIPLAARGAGGHGLPAAGTCTVDTQGRAVDPHRECPWPVAEGGVRFHVAVWTAGHTDVVDLVVERCEAATDERPSTPLLKEDLLHGELRTWHETLSLPTCRVRVDSRRAYVPVGAEAVLHLDRATRPTCQSPCAVVPCPLDKRC